MNETLRDLETKRAAVIFDFDMLYETEEREQTKRTIRELKNDLAEYKQLYNYEVEQNKELKKIANDFQLLYELEIHEKLEQQKQTLNERLKKYTGETKINLN